MQAETTIQRVNGPTRTAEERAEAMDNPAWGGVFTDHMVTADYTPDRGWHDLTIRPFGSFTMHPASAVLHYGQAIFEGLKGYWQPDGSVAAFRPGKNAERFAGSARRLAMPPLPEAMFMESLRELAEVDRAWVPRSHGASLYFRPLMFSTDSMLMTKPSSTYRYLLFACPVADYFKNGVKPVTVWVSTEFVRAARGGTGEAKCAGNYAASYLVQGEAIEKGCDQVVWLDAVDRETIEEMGGMNVFFVRNDGGTPRLITPAASGSLLKGVTRDSLLHLAADLGIPAEEGHVTMSEWRAGCESGAISESFACGTAAVITPIGRVKADNVDFTIADGGTGSVTAKLRQALLDLQHGEAPDPHAWRVTLVPPDQARAE